MPAIVGSRGPGQFTKLPAQFTKLLASDGRADVRSADGGQHISALQNKPPVQGHPVEDAGPPRCDSMVGLLRPGFRRLQGLDSGQYKPASWRSRRALIEISLHSAIGDRPPGLVVVEIAELPDQPPQADPALWP